MDEATSALDATTENEITTLLASLHGQRTIVTIAHRLSTIRRCDTIFILDEGRILDQGSFEELAARSPILREMLVHSSVSDVPLSESLPRPAAVG
jgi:ATP-binding cassette, subfamily B, bacterial PglK